MLREIVTPELSSMITNVSHAVLILRHMLRRLPGDEDLSPSLRRLARYADGMDLTICKAERSEFSALPENEALAMAGLLGRVPAFAAFVRECSANDAQSLTFLIELTTPEPDDGAAEIVRLAGVVAPALGRRIIAGGRKLKLDLEECKKREEAIAEKAILARTKYPA